MGLWARAGPNHGRHIYSPLLGVGEFQATPRIKGHLDFIIHLFYNGKAPQVSFSPIPRLSR